MLRVAGLICLFLGPPLAASAAEKVPSDPLKRRIAVLELANESLMDGVARLSQTTGMAFSIEHILKASLESAPVVDPTFTTEIRGKTLRQVLDRLCQLDPRYTWVSDSKMINILPRDKLNDHRYLTNRILRDFKLDGASRADQPVFRALSKLPGPREQLAYLQAGGSFDYSELWTQEFAEVTIRELLNLSARKLGPTFGWQLSGSQNFRVITFHAWLPSSKQKGHRSEAQ